MPSPRPLAAAARVPSRQRVFRLGLALFAMAWLFLAPAARGSGQSVVLLTATGVVDSVMRRAAPYPRPGMAGCAPQTPGDRQATMQSSTTTVTAPDGTAIFTRLRRNARCETRWQCSSIVA